MAIAQAQDAPARTARWTCAGPPRPAWRPPGVRAALHLLRGAPVPLLPPADRERRGGGVPGRGDVRARRGDAARERARRAGRGRPPLGDGPRPRLRAAHERRNAVARPDSRRARRARSAPRISASSPRQRMTLALRDLEGRPDDEIALALGADTATVGALVARARLRLRQELELPGARDGCDDRAGRALGLCRRHAPARRAARRSRRTLRPARAVAPRSSRCARPCCATARCPVPVPPGELRSRMTVALGAVGFPTRRPRALMPDPAPAASGRPLAAAVTMAALVIVGAGVTFVASRSDDGRDEPARTPAPSPSASPRRRAPRTRRCTPASRPP